MMNELQIFNNTEFGRVRVINNDGQPWFVAKDVCDILGLTNPTVTIQKLDSDEVTKFNLGGLSGEMNLVNESGLYTLIIRSDKSQAKQFRKWVTSEVIPSVRKHGAYMTSQKIEEVLLSPDTIIKLATELKEEREERYKLERQNNELKPKAEFAEHVAQSDNSILIRELAKVICKQGINIGEKRLYKKLREWGLIFRNSTEPKQEYIDRGYFEIIESVKNTGNKTLTFRTTRVTGKGQVYIANKLLRERSLEMNVINI